MSKIFDAPTEVFEEQIDKLFSHKSTSNIDTLMNVLSLLVYQNTNNGDITDLYNTLTLNDFVKVITLFEGRTVKFPAKKDIKEWLILALCYYYREVEGMEWDEIHKILPFKISSISYGIKIRNLDRYIEQKMRELFMEENDE